MSTGLRLAIARDATLRAMEYTSLPARPPGAVRRFGMRQPNSRPTVRRYAALFGEGHTGTTAVSHPATGNSPEQPERPFGVTGTIHRSRW